MSYDYNGILSYSYSKYRGKDFLKDYLVYRQEIIDKLDTSNDNIEKYFKMYETKKEIDCLDSYLILSYNLLNLYENTQDLRYFNTVLKINDLICANFDRIMDKKLLFLVLNREIVFFKKLLFNEGITI